MAPKHKFDSFNEYIGINKLLNVDFLGPLFDSYCGVT